MRIEYHILQSFPVTCLNRDDVGSPKTALIGGIPRARVSSQCWKRQVRLALKDLGMELGIRTKHVEDLLKAACLRQGATEEQAIACATPVADAMTDNTLLFFSQTEADAIAQYAKSTGFEPEALAAKGKKKLDPKLVKVIKGSMNPVYDGLDIALFGRMVAQAPEMNMQAAASFAHAITTHEASNEVDFFTALDDMGTEPGSAHMGMLEFNSGTYYRYISLDLGQLAENLGEENVPEAVEAFTKALYLAVPSARQTTQAGMRPWDYARIIVRKGQGMQASFDEAVASKNGYLQPSIKALENQLERVKKQSGSLYNEQGSYVLGADSDLDIDMLAQKLADHAKAGSASR